MLKLAFRFYISGCFSGKFEFLVKISQIHVPLDANHSTDSSVSGEEL